jgi:gamma-glutamyl-gamma-aminobutyrate hydrolase PuuD
MGARTDIRIGLTCRVAVAEGHGERRDCLGQDWARLLARVIPDVPWQMLPNIGRAAVRHAEAWGVNAIVLTGGNDLGEDVVKDDTDLALLERALEVGWPVLGVCRGMQVLVRHFGGRLEQISDSSHVARSHPVRWSTTMQSVGPVTVNSFHRWVVPAQGVPDSLEPLAWAGDGTVEAVGLRNRPIIGLMWHPERDVEIAPFSVKLFRSLFLTENPQWPVV